MYSLFSRFTFIFAAFALIFISVSMVLSWRTNNLKSSYQKLERQRVEIQGNFRILNAEWARLNTPMHLKAMADAYFHTQLKHIDNNTIVDNVTQLGESLQ